MIIRSSDPSGTFKDWKLNPLPPNQRVLSTHVLLCLVVATLPAI